MGIPHQLRHYLLRGSSRLLRIFFFAFILRSAPPKTTRMHTLRNGLLSERSGPFYLDSTRCIRCYRRSQKLCTTDFTIRTALPLEVSGAKEHASKSRSNGFESSPRTLPCSMNLVLCCFSSFPRTYGLVLTKPAYYKAWRWPCLVISCQWKPAFCTLVLRFIECPGDPCCRYNFVARTRTDVGTTLLHGLYTHESSEYGNANMLKTGRRRK